MLWIIPAYAENIALPFVEDAGIQVDGQAMEASWASALVLPDTEIFRPSNNLTTTGSMKTRLLADSKALYLHFEVMDPEPALVRAGLGRRDSRGNDDMVGLFLDPGGEGRRAYGFFATPLGVQGDCLHLPGSDDWSWDAVWASGGHRTAIGYEVEFAIPWRALSGDSQHIGLVIFRELARKGQSYSWPRVPTGSEPLLVEAVFQGPRALPEALGLSIRPELTGAWAMPPVESGRLEFYGIGPGLTLDFKPSHAFGALATFNPDFSQLESDATQIDTNLRYALDYSEKRAFFLEQQEWFQHPFEGFVYTRSMNAPLYGLRFATEAGSVGIAALHVLDRAPPASVNEGGGWTEEQLFGQQSLSSLGRLRFGLGQDSYIGLLGSDRTVLNTGLYDRVFGVDSVVRVQKLALFEGAVLGSYTSFQEEEAPVLASAGTLGMRWSGERLNLHTTAVAIAPDFRHENGFFLYSDRIGVLSENHYNFFPEVDWLSKVSLELLDCWAYWHLDGRLRERGMDPSIWAQAGNGAFIKLDGRFAGEEFEEQWVDYANAELYAYSSIGAHFVVEAGGRVGSLPYYDAENFRAGFFQSGWAWLNIQPVSRFQLGLEPEIARMTELSGELLFLSWTARMRAELFLTRSIWLRTVLQTSGEGEQLNSWRVEPVAAWEWSPGKAAYLGGSYGVEEVPGWQVFAKISWVFTL